jgi:hypothetical protein
VWSLKKSKKTQFKLLNQSVDSVLSSASDVIQNFFESNNILKYTFYAESVICNQGTLSHQIKAENQTTGAKNCTKVFL